MIRQSVHPSIGASDHQTIRPRQQAEADAEKEWLAAVKYGYEKNEQAGGPAPDATQPGRPPAPSPTSTADQIIADHPDWTKQQVRDELGRITGGGTR